VADAPGTFATGTDDAVRQFQKDRGLRVDGQCGAQTWNALVEAGYRLGDRLLYHRVPLLRGDDVATLQRRLSALGFDAGRVDGIFGPRTAGALAEFQRNAGLVVDGTCGRETLAALTRLGGRLDAAVVVADVRERAKLLAGPRTLQHLRVVLGEPGGLSALTDALAKQLSRAGATVAILRDPDESAQATGANDLHADVYVGLILDPARHGAVTSYYAHPVTGAASAGGRRLAEAVQRALPDAIDGADVEIRGMTLPVLRETRMPAIVCELGPPTAVVAATAVVAGALAAAVELWVADPCAESTAD
jgi:N-acetylmuramoyl-L-alanine amidase